MLLSARWAAPTNRLPLLLRGCVLAGACCDEGGLPPIPCAPNRTLSSAAACEALAAPPPRTNSRHSSPLLEPWRHAASPIEQAATPPSSWYTQSSVLHLEEQTVFRHSWLAVAHASQLAAPGSYAAGSLLGLQWLACRDEAGHLRAFHNVCRHHAAILAQGTGTADCFRCPYHGWTYGLDGRLLRATRLRGIQEFRAQEHGLAPLQAEEWGGFVWVRQAAGLAAVQQQQQQTQVAAGGNAPPSSGVLSMQQQQGQQQQEVGQQQGQGQQQQLLQQQQQQQQGVAAWLGKPGAAAALAGGIADPGLVHVGSREYELNCNWKVFADNYLDGGYHVSVAHPGLASGLDLASYRSTVYERLSIQSCQPARCGGDAAAAGFGVAGAGSAAAEQAGAAARVGAAGYASVGGAAAAGQQGASGGGAGEGKVHSLRRLAAGRAPAYVFIYPNLMLNRYGPWLDVNTVIPLAADRCKVLFDYYLQADLAADVAFVDASLAASHQVQLEDVTLCESVQQGLASSGYDVGRYAPGVEGPMFHFHQLLHADLAAPAAGAA